MCGLKKTADLNNLSESDFLILDPAYPKKANMADRPLLRGDHNNDNPGIKGYALGIFTDRDKYLNQSSALYGPIGGDW